MTDRRFSNLNRLLKNAAIVIARSRETRDRGNLNSLVNSAREIAALPATRVSSVARNDRIITFSTTCQTCQASRLTARETQSRM
jgi:hypothetical protein